MDIPKFLPADGHLGCLELLSNEAVMNIHVHISLCTFNVSGVNGIAGSRVKCMLSLGRTYNYSPTWLYQLVFLPAIYHSSTLAIVFLPPPLG